MSIYEELLSLKSAWIPVAVPDGSGGWTCPEADLRMAERRRDGATRPPLFTRIGKALDDPAFDSLAALFDNYERVKGRRDVQLSEPHHVREIENLLDAILPTEAMQLAAHYLMEEDPAEFPDEAIVHAWVKQVWFEPFLNEFSHAEWDCCGFEHVFVGELYPRAFPGDRKDDVGGYHSWIKYAADQQQGQVRYLGHDYRPGVERGGLASSNIASVVMEWRHEGHWYLKNPGGFFVGDRPELQFALGAVGVFDAMRNQFGGSGSNGEPSHRRVVLGNDIIDLVLYAQTIRSGNARKFGPHLRSMYPKYRGPVGDPHTPPAGRPGSPTQEPMTPINSGPVRIVAALPNPDGEDDGREWVELVNVSAHLLQLDGWTLRDASNRFTPLAGPIAPGETRRFTFDRAAGGVQLANAGGWILLYSGDSRAAAVRYGTALSGQVFSFLS